MQHELEPFEFTNWPRNPLAVVYPSHPQIDTTKNIWTNTVHGKSTTNKKNHQHMQCVATLKQTTEATKIMDKNKFLCRPSGCCKGFKAYFVLSILTVLLAYYWNNFASILANDIPKDIKKGNSSPMIQKTYDSSTISKNRIRGQCRPAFWRQQYFYSGIAVKKLNNVEKQKLTYNES